MAGDVRRAAVHEVLRSFILQTLVNYDSEFILDTLWNVQPMWLGVKQLGQAMIKLLGKCGPWITQRVKFGSPCRQPNTNLYRLKA